MLKHFTKILFIFFLSLNSFFVKAQLVTIPDPNFVAWLNANGFASCMTGNMLDTTCSQVTNTSMVHCDSAMITDLTGIQYFDSLDVLYCFYNQLTFLPPLHAPLYHLDCSHNNLTVLPDLPYSLMGLACYDNQITSLPALNPGLTSISCGENSIASLPALPPLLTDLHCFSNMLTTLPPLPGSLANLNCKDNQLTSLPNLPSTLYFLDCSLNQLISLPTLPNGLEIIQCNDNLLTSLPVLPDSLTFFNCYNNQLDSLPGLPSKLGSFSCSDNPLTALPDFPSSLYFLHCTNTLISEIPALPDSMDYVIIRDNPSLDCFPRYKIINNLEWINTGITCLPNIGYIGTANPSVSNLPLCQPGSGCDFFWNIFGKVFFDGNNNCINDSNEIVWENIPVILDSGGNQLQIFITNSEGYYSFETGLGNYQIKIDTAGLPFDVTCPAGGNYLSTLTSLDSLDADLDFGLECKAGYLDLIAKSISPSAPLRPSVQRTLYLDAGDATLFYGVTCATGVNGSVEAILNGPVSYISPAAGALTPATVNGDTIFWSVNDFSLINPVTDFNIIVQVDSSAAINDSICVQLNVYPAADNMPSNNSLSNCFSIVNSYDPNAKEIYPAGFVDTTQFDFTFTIFFQNTGIAVAENIYIHDTLDNDLKLNTFQFLSSSHDVITQMLPGRILRFSFPHINLPDSISNEPASHGYVQFKVSRKNILYPDMIILNNAHIFFDLNPGVVTNDAYAILNFNCNNLLSLVIPDTAICENEILTASNNINFPFPVNYEWVIDTTTASTTSSVSLGGLSPGTHQLTLNVSAGYCTVSQTQQIFVYALPLQPVINISGDTLSTDPGFSYQWFLNNDSLAGAVQNNYLISQSGWYSVMITDANGCSALSDSVFVSPVGIEEISEMRFNVYPNPVEDMLYIQTISAPGEFLNIELLDITGRKLKTIFKGNSPYAFSKFTLPVKTFSEGVFILKINNLVRKIVIE